MISIIWVRGLCVPRFNCGQLQVLNFSRHRLEKTNRKWATIIHFFKVEPDVFAADQLLPNLDNFHFWGAVHVETKAYVVEIGGQYFPMFIGDLYLLEPSQHLL